MAIARAELQKLAEDFGQIPPDLKKELRPAIRKAARPVLAQMRSNASWSTRIPPATRIATSFSVRRPGVSIVVDAGKAPHARPYEHMGVPGYFRHPVYGDREVWVRQRARPFFFRAVEAKAGEVTRAIGDTVDRIVKQHGF